MSKIVNPKRFMPGARLLGAFLGAAFVLAGYVSSEAQGIISLRIDVGGSPGSAHDYNHMYLADMAGAPGVRTNNWNNIPAPYNANSPSTIGTNGIYDASGTTIPNMGCAAYFGGGGSDGWFDRVAPTISTNDGKMFADVSDTYGNNAIANFGYLQVTNVPYTNYNLYCYFRDDNGSGNTATRGGVWVITNTPSGAQRIYISNQTNDGSYAQIALPNNSGSGYVQAGTTAIVSGGAAWTSIQGGNFVEFTGLTNANLTVFFNGLGNGSGAKDDLGNYVNGGSSAVRFKICGFQIVQVNLSQVTNVYFGSATTTLHAGNPAGTQSTVDANTAGGQVLTVTPLAAYFSDNTNVVTVSATGLLTPGTNGTAHVIASYQGLFATNTVAVIGPASLYLVLGNTNLLSGNGQGDTTTATLYANFSDANNVPVNSYQFVSFSGTPGVVTITTNGSLMAVAQGTFSITGTYDQMSVTTNSVGMVTAFSAPGSVPSFAVKLTDSSSHYMTFHDLSGAPGSRFAYWNNMPLTLGTYTNTLAGPYDYHGNVLVNTVIEVEPTNQNDQLITTAGTATTNESTLFDTYIDLGMNNGVTVLNTMVISNVPYSSYDVYFYCYNDTTSNGTNRPGVFIIDGVQQYRINSTSANTQPDNNGNGYTQALPQPGGIPASVTDVPYGNFVKFTGVTDSVLTVQWGAVGNDFIGDAATVTRLRLAGFQVVSSLDGLTATDLYLQAPVPALLAGNPTSYSLTLLANFSNGTTNGDITDLPGVTYTSANTSLFNVDTNGNITPGTVPGTANLIIKYQTLSLTQAVTVLAPTTVTVTAIPNTVYIDSTIGVQPAQAGVYANYSGNYTNVNITSFNTITYVDQGSPVATLGVSGAITANTQGTAALGVNFLGTNWVTANGIAVSSITNPPVLKHLYGFTDATNSTTVLDSIGGANGTIYPPLSTNKPITLDGKHVIFPGDGVYTDEPYIGLPQYLIADMGDVSIELWGGVSQRNTWARFLGFGNTPKGTTPYVYGGTASTNSLQIMGSYAGTGDLDFVGLGSGDLETPYSLTNGSEYYIVAVLAPNAGIKALYVNGSLISTVGDANNQYLASVDDEDDWLGVSLSNDDSPLAGWMNRLAVWEGVMTASQVTSNYAAGQSVYTPPGPNVPTNSIPIGFSVSGGNLNLKWPPNYLGWRLQVQTNTLDVGINTNWVTVPNSTSVTNESIQIGLDNASVFYRLVYP